MGWLRSSLGRLQLSSMGLLCLPTGQGFQQGSRQGRATSVHCCPGQRDRLVGFSSGNRPQRAIWPVVWGSRCRRSEQLVALDDSRSKTETLAPTGSLASPSAFRCWRACLRSGSVVEGGGTRCPAPLPSSAVLFWRNAGRSRRETGVQARPCRHLPVA